MSPQKHPHFHIKEFLGITKHIIDDTDFKELKKYRQHMFFNRYEHLINVSFFAYQLARLFRADIETCALAGILHDYHFITKLRLNSHPMVAAENAQRFSVSEEVIEIVRFHMYPFGLAKNRRPRGKNFWIVKVADSFAALFEIIYSVLFLSFSHNKIKFRRNKLIIEMLKDF